MSSHRYLVSLAAAATAAVVLSACGSSSSPSSSGSPANLTSQSGSQIVTTAVAATKKQSSLHFEETAGRPGTGVVVVGDVASSSGQQTITITSGKKTGHVYLLLAGNTAYFKGDAFGLEGFTQFTPALATRFANKWIAVPSTNQGFAALTGTLQVSGVADNLVKMPGTLTNSGTSTRAGTAVVAVQAKQSSTGGTLSLVEYVATGGPSLPVLVQGSTSSTTAGNRAVKATFGRWGEPVHVRAPSSSVPIATVEAAASSTTTTTPGTTTTPSLG